MIISTARLTTLALACGLFAAATASAQTATTPAAAPRATAPAPATRAATPAPAARAATAAAPSAAAPGQAASAEKLFSTWDKDRNKQLTLEEFRTGWEEARMANMLGRLEEQFRAADTNRNSALEAAEYANLPLIKRGGPNAPALSAFDANKNNSLDFKEYLTLVQTALKQAGQGR